MEDREKSASASSGHAVTLPRRPETGNGRVSPVSASSETPSASNQTPEVRITDLCLSYGDAPALKHISMDIPRGQVTAFIGPSGCGKSTLLRCLNRLNDLIDDCTTSGSIDMGGIEILDPTLDVTALRKRVGMVFQKPNPFPKSLYENVAYGPRVLGIKNRVRLDELVESSLKAAALWDEVKDRLHDSALALSGGQHQRVCIARTIAV